MKTKKCWKCKNIKLASDFYKNKSKSDKLSSECKECSKNRLKIYKKHYSKIYREKHREKINERHRQQCKNYYYKNRRAKKCTHCRTLLTIFDQKTICNKCSERQRGYHKKRYDRIREEIFHHYGNECAWCGIKDQIVLSIDHINDDGAKQRKMMQNGLFYRWLKRENFPEGYQILCRNCNWRKRMGVKREGQNEKEENNNSNFISGVAV